MGTPRRHSIKRRTTGGGAAIAAGFCAVLVCSASGCRSGTTALSAPSWWSFGGVGGADPSKLAAAPPFDGKSDDGKIVKPSQSATPYPTTTTPNGYVAADAKKGQPVDPTAPAIAAAVPAAVTYGSTPPPASTAQPPAAAKGTSLSSIVPQADSTQPAPAGAAQVGPYATLPGQIPAAGSSQPLVPPPLAPGMNSSPPLAGVPAAGAFPATAGYEPAPRVADSRAGDAYGLTPAAPTQPAANPAGASRYSGSMSSRFGGAIEPPPVAPLATPSAIPTAPAALPGSAPAGFGAPASPGFPPAPPARRPDPGYRPGGTSSYRPSQSILVEDQPTPRSAVRTAAYEVPAATSP